MALELSGGGHFYVLPLTKFMLNVSAVGATTLPLPIIAPTLTTCLFLLNIPLNISIYQTTFIKLTIVP